jgi:NAD(P)-dependent dehydrogenase (short-subunit alcohol dehydrogenase family)
MMDCVVIGASGGIGAALATALENQGRTVLRLGRRTTPPLDLHDQASIATAAAMAGAGLRLVIDATGFLHGQGFTPEKSLRQLDPLHMAHSFAINATGPALLLKHFLPRLARGERAVFATLSARVGSIEDNRLGGWISYRASKAALNQIMRTAAIELRTLRQSGAFGRQSGGGRGAAACGHRESRPSANRAAAGCHRRGDRVLSPRIRQRAARPAAEAPRPGRGR